MDRRWRVFSLRAMQLSLAKVLQGASNNRKIFRAAIIVASFTVLAKATATFKELVVAQVFGRNDALDAFLIAFLLPSFLVAVLCGSLHSAFVPVFIHIREQEGMEFAERLLSGLTAVSLVVLTAFSVLLAVLAPYCIQALAHGFAPAKMILAARLLYILLPFIVLSGLTSLWAAALNAGERFALPAFTPALTPLVIVAFIFLAGRHWGIFSVAAGTVAGQAVESAFLIRSLKSRGLRLRFSWQGTGPYVRRVLLQCAPLAAGAIIAGGTTLVDQSMSTMLGSGSVSALNYANKIINVLLGVGALALGKSTLPYFSRMVANQDWSGFQHTIRTYVRLVILATIPLTLALFLFSKPLVRLIFERGSFTASDTAVVSPVLAFYSLQIPFYVLGIIGVNVLSSIKRNDILFYVAGFDVVLDIVLNFAFMRIWGIAGIALSSSVVSVASLIIVAVCARKFINSLSHPSHTMVSGAR